MMVRVPGQPVAVRVYAEVAHGEAARYAAEAGGEVVSLSLLPPHGYIADSTRHPGPVRVARVRPGVGLTPCRSGRAKEPPQPTIPNR
jgi:hypothetical protein